MIVRALDQNNDFVFGAGKANYISEKKALNQKVATRIKSFKNDNPLNMDANIDWLDLLGRKGTENTILREIERVVLQTEGVTKLTNIEVVKTENRVQSLTVQYVTIYDREETIEVIGL